jgi:DNA repair protein RadC
MSDGDSRKWRHPGGKLRELGAAALTDEELLAIIISSGVKGRTASAIAADLLGRFDSLPGLCDIPLERLLAVKGLSDVKITRIAAAFELARRLSRGIGHPIGTEKE